MKINLQNQKNITEPPVKTAASPTRIKPAAQIQQTGTMRSAALPASAGLPPSAAAVITFARFFSLPLKPQLMAEIHRQVVSTQTNLQTQTNASQAQTQVNVPAHTNVSAQQNPLNTEVLTLAACASEAKGAELEQKAMETYALAIDPDRKKQEDGQNDSYDKNEKEQKQQLQKTEGFSASNIKELALEAEKNNPLVSILNKLPCKNGQRWIVLPFSFCDHGKNFNVSLRILLEAGKPAKNHVVHMALDIASSDTMYQDALETTPQENAAGKNRKLFVLNEGSPSLMVYLQPESSPEALTSFSRKLAEVMAVSPAHIKVKNAPESFFTESLNIGDFYSINEEV